MTDEQIAEIFGSVPYFVDDTILPCRALTEERWPFRSMFTWCHDASVNILRIYGTQHPDYTGLTWREFLSKGRRMESNLQAFQANPSYYTEHIKRLPGMSLHILDGKGFVGEDGNHRTCIGRFYLYDKDCPFMHGLSVGETQTDLRMLSLYKQVKTHLPGYCTVTPISKEVARDDGNGWATHFFDVTLRVENGRRKGYSAEFEASEVETGLIPALKSGIFARFGEYKNLLF